MSCVLYANSYLPAARLLLYSTVPAHKWTFVFIHSLLPSRSSCYNSTKTRKRLQESSSYSHMRLILEYPTSMGRERNKPRQKRYNMMKLFGYLYIYLAWLGLACVIIFHPPTVRPVIFCSISLSPIHPHHIFLRFINGMYVFFLSLSLYLILLPSNPI